MRTSVSTGAVLMAGVAVLAICLTTLRLSADEPDITRFPGVAGNPASPYTPRVCLDLPTTEDPVDCSWWISERGDTWVPWESAVILPASGKPNPPSGGHLVARDMSWIGRGFGLECASLQGFAVIVSSPDVYPQMNAMEVPCRAPQAQVYFPGRVNIGSHVNQRGGPDSALHLREGYLHLPVHANEPPANDCEWPRYGGRVAVVIDVASGADTMSWRICGPHGWGGVE